MRLNLLCLLVPAAVLPFVRDCPSLSFLAAAALLAATVLTYGIKTGGYRQQWFAGRAVAESVKTLAWKYAMGAEPYQSLGEAEVNQTFVNDLRAILKENRSGLRLGCALPTDWSTITDDMRSLRGRAWEERRSSYVDLRLKDQHQWYSSKARGNLERSNQFFAAIMIAQLVAIASAFLYAVDPKSYYNMASLGSVVASSLLAWMNLRNYETLGQSYGLAAQELSFNFSLVKGASTEDEFVKIVSDAENAISREHTMWLARRDQP